MTFLFSCSSVFFRVRNEVEYCERCGHGFDLETRSRNSPKLLHIHLSEMGESYLGGKVTIPEVIYRALLC